MLQFSNAIILFWNIISGHLCHKKMGKKWKLVLIYTGNDCVSNLKMRKMLLALPIWQKIQNLKEAVTIKAQISQNEWQFNGRCMNKVCGNEM